MIRIINALLKPWERVDGNIYGYQIERINGLYAPVLYVNRRRMWAYQESKLIPCLRYIWQYMTLYVKPIKPGARWIGCGGTDGDKFPGRCK